MAKIKAKTHSGAKKRLKKTANGKIKVRSPGARHLLAGKRPKRMRRLKKAGYVFEGSVKRVSRMLPNG